MCIEHASRHERKQISTVLMKSKEKEMGEKFCWIIFYDYGCLSRLIWMCDKNCHKFQDRRWERMPDFSLLIRIIKLQARTKWKTFLTHAFLSLHATASCHSIVLITCMKLILIASQTEWKKRSPTNHFSTMSKVEIQKKKTMKSVNVAIK